MDTQLLCSRFETPEGTPAANTESSQKVPREHQNEEKAMRVQTFLLQCHTGKNNLVVTLKQV